MECARGGGPYISQIQLFFQRAHEAAIGPVLERIGGLQRLRHLEIEMAPAFKKWLPVMSWTWVEQLAVALRRLGAAGHLENVEFYVSWEAVFLIHRQLPDGTVKVEQVDGPQAPVEGLVEERSAVPLGLYEELLDSIPSSLTELFFRPLPSELIIRTFSSLAGGRLSRLSRLDITGDFSTGQWEGWLQPCRAGRWGKGSLCSPWRIEGVPRVAQKGCGHALCGVTEALQVYWADSPRNVQSLEKVWQGLLPAP
jgi:hypothetical protein